MHRVSGMASKACSMTSMAHMASKAGSMTSMADRASMAYFGKHLKAA